MKNKYYEKNKITKFLKYYIILKDSFVLLQIEIDIKIFNFLIHPYFYFYLYEFFSINIIKFQKWNYLTIKITV